ncbi:MAG: DUF922 domain-containing protein [Magnetococcales bacterium]|nr:DUF922 domain-containing protein [Magnetococcales bacterium]
MRTEKANQGHATLFSVPKGSQSTGHLVWTGRHLPWLLIVLFVGGCGDALYPMPNAYIAPAIPQDMKGYFEFQVEHYDIKGDDWIDLGREMRLHSPAQKVSHEEATGRAEHLAQQLTEQQPIQDDDANQLYHLQHDLARSMEETKSPTSFDMEPQYQLDVINDGDGLCRIDPASFLGARFTITMPHWTNPNDTFREAWQRRYNNTLRHAKGHAHIAIVRLVALNYWLETLKGKSLQPCDKLKAIIEEQVMQMDNTVRRERAEYQASELLRQQVGELEGFTDLYYDP